MDQAVQHGGLLRLFPLPRETVQALRLPRRQQRDIDGHLQKDPRSPQELAALHRRPLQGVPLRPVTGHAGQGPALRGEVPPQREGSAGAARAEVERRPESRRVQPVLRHPSGLRRARHRL